MVVDEIGYARVDAQEKNRLHALCSSAIYCFGAMRNAMSMLSFRNRTHRSVWSVVCLASFLALLLFSSSPRLHKLIHPDADSADHQCAITMLAQGQVNAPVTPPVLVAFVPFLFSLLPPLQLAPISSFDYRFSSSRAPPLV